MVSDGHVTWLVTDVTTGLMREALFQPPGEAAGGRRPLQPLPVDSGQFVLSPHPAPPSGIRGLVHKQLHDIIYRNQKGTSQPHWVKEVSEQTVLETTYTNWHDIHISAVLHSRPRSESLWNVLVIGNEWWFSFLSIKFVLWERHTRV